MLEMLLTVFFGMVSDFFYPNTGGVESHIYQLSQCLIARGHKVVVLTHSYENRKGVRYMSKGLKVYYIPLWVVYNQCSFPTLFVTFPLVRCILLRERITIVHGHSAFSTLAHEAMFHAKTLGLKTVFTDHSLFGFADLSAIITNKLLQMSLAICNHVICVSHIGKENTALRARVRPDLISVIPNAVDTAVFTPDPSQRDPSKITIVVVSRLVYRKGVNLMAGVIPLICSRYSDVSFLIGGEGSKKIVLEEMIEECDLQDRVTLLGAIKHENVRDQLYHGMMGMPKLLTLISQGALVMSINQEIKFQVPHRQELWIGCVIHMVLVKGDIFLNASLTEAFCMAIVEAASCGLQVVSTRVGGVPEVLPPEFIWLTDASVEADNEVMKGLLEGLERAIADRSRKKVVPPQRAHQRICEMYQWPDIAYRTERVYNLASQEPTDNLQERLQKFWQQGYLSGGFFMLLQLIEHLLLFIFTWLVPTETIDICREFSKREIAAL